MKIFKKAVILSAVVAMGALPLASCSNTWQGFKHDVGAMSDSMSSSSASASAQVTPDQGPASYNK